LTWAPDSQTQIRFRYERVLGQLDFNNFIAKRFLRLDHILLHFLQLLHHAALIAATHRRATEAATTTPFRH